MAFIWRLCKLIKVQGERLVNTVNSNDDRLKNAFYKNLTTFDLFSLANWNFRKHLHTTLLLLRMFYFPSWFNSLSYAKTLIKESRHKLATSSFYPLLTDLHIQSTLFEDGATWFWEGAFGDNNQQSVKFSTSSQLCNPVPRAMTS